MTAARKLADEIERCLHPNMGDDFLRNLSLTAKEWRHVITLLRATGGEADAKAPHQPAAFINAIAEEGSKDEAIAALQETWNDLYRANAELRVLRARRIACAYCNPIPDGGYVDAGTAPIDIVELYEVLTGDVSCPLGHQDALREIQRRLVPFATRGKTDGA